MQLEQAEDAGGLGSGFPGNARPSGLRDTARRARVLVVDDEASGRRALERLLRADGFSTAIAEDGEDALAEVAREPPDLILTDLHMPRMSGVELCKRIHDLHPDLPVIVMTAFGDMASTVESLRAGAEDYLLKPLEYELVRLPPFAVGSHSLDLVIDERLAAKCPCVWALFAPERSPIDMIGRQLVDVVDRKR